MENLISEIEYEVPNPDRPIGSLIFKVSIPVLYRDGQKSVAEGEGLDVSLSAETSAAIESLGKLIIKDLEK